MKPLPLPPNIPVTVALVDPEGAFDFEVGVGRYQTTTGELLTLPRPAVVLLNALEAKPGEQITVTKHWTGRIGDKSVWTIDKAGARAEKSAGTATVEPDTPQPPIEPHRGPVAVPMPIRRPSRGRPPEQPSLFDRGTGTYGPAPAPKSSFRNYFSPRPIRTDPAGPVPANVATREILAFIAADPNTADWSCKARQELASTIYIGIARLGYITLWERAQ